VTRSHSSVERFTVEEPTAQTTALGPGSEPTAVARGQGAVWVVTALSTPTLFMIDPPTNRVITKLVLPALSVPSGVAAGEGAVWVADVFHDTILRIEPRLRSSSPLSHSDKLAVVARIRVGSAPSAVAVGRRSVWVTNKLDGTVSRIDPATNRVVGTFRVGAWPDHVAVDAGNVWVALDPPARDGAND